MKVMSRDKINLSSEVVLLLGVLNLWGDNI